jgi:hypothetical protein
MYAPQSSINPALAALMQTAQMVTPSGDDTVAAQVAQAAAQKLQPQQGIAQGMPEAQEDLQAAMPSMMRNMQQQQMQKMVKQAMQPQPAGIEGLPAPNMQSMADGGVVGYSGKEGSEVKTQAEEDRETIASALRAIRDKALIPAGAALADVATAIPRGIAGAYNSTILRAVRAAGVPIGYIPDPTGNDFSSATPFYDKYAREAPEASYSNESQVGLASKPVPSQPTAVNAPAPAPRPPAPRPPASQPPAAPAAGIAQLVAPTEDRSKVDTAGGAFLDEARKQEANRRKIAAEKEAAIKGMPDLNEQGIAALKRAEEERRRLLGVDQSDDSRRRWAGIFRGWGGDRDAYDRILTGIANRDAAANQAQLNFDQAQLKLREAQQAKALGQFDRAEKLEAEVAELYDKANKNKLQAQQIEASLASNKYATDASIYNTKVTDAAKTADRMQQAQLEGAKLKQQAEQNNQMKLANLINSANITVNSAIEKMEKTLANKYGAMINIINTMTPEMLQKQPQMAATYDAYLKDKDALYKQTVEPAVMQRNRLASQVSGAQDLSKWGEPTVKKGG